MYLATYTVGESYVIRVRALIDAPTLGRADEIAHAMIPGSGSTVKSYTAGRMEDMARMGVIRVEQIESMPVTIDPAIDDTTESCIQHIVRVARLHAKRLEHDDVVLAVQTHRRLLATRDHGTKAEMHGLECDALHAISQRR